MNNEQNTTNTQDSKLQNTVWLRNFAIGLVLFISGILAKFFPSTVMTVVYIVSGVIFALIGISDCISAFKYKKSGADHKLILITGAASIAAAVYFIPAVIYLYKMNISLYVLSVWLIARGALNIFGKSKGSIKRKNVTLWALVSILAGIIIAVFCEQIVTYSANYLAYILIGAGTLLAFFGIYRKTDEKESLEKSIREEEISKGLPAAIETAQKSPETEFLEDIPAENSSLSSPAPGTGAEIDNETQSMPHNPGVSLTEENKENEKNVDAQIVETAVKKQDTKKKGFFKSFLK